MDRNELVNSDIYKVTSASIEYWRTHGELDGLSEAFEAGAECQQKIDIEKACRAVCSFCQDKERCDADSYDPIEHIHLAVSCDKIDALVEAMEG